MSAEEQPINELLKVAQMVKDTVVDAETRLEAVTTKMKTTLKELDRLEVRVGIVKNDIARMYRRRDKK